MKAVGLALLVIALAIAFGINPLLIVSSLATAGIMLMLRRE